MNDLLVHDRRHTQYLRCVVRTGPVKQLVHDPLATMGVLAHNRELTVGKNVIQISGPQAGRVPSIRVA